MMDASAKTATYQVQIWDDYVNTAKDDLVKKGLIINEVTDYTAFQKYARPIWDKFAPIVGKDLIDEIVNTP